MYCIVLNEQNSKDIIDTNVDGIIVNDISEIQNEINALVYDDKKMDEISKRAVQRVKEKNNIELLIDLDINDFNSLFKV